MCSSHKSLLLHKSLLMHKLGMGGEMFLDQLGSVEHMASALGGTGVM